MGVRLYNIHSETENDAIVLNEVSFSGGEFHVTLSPESIKGKNLWIDCRYNSSEDFMKAVILADAVKRLQPSFLGLFIPYFPGAQQDHPEIGTPFTVKVHADIINSFNFNVVIVADPHSPVTPALVNRCEILSSSDIFIDVLKDKGYSGIICPDAGAEKRALNIAKALDLSSNIIYCHKVRDQLTGSLSGFRSGPFPSEGRFLIVDDICIRGGTFIGLLEEIRKNYNSDKYKIDLLFTHGVLPMGLEDIASHFNRTYTSDSVYKRTHVPSEFMTVVKLFPFARNIMMRRFYL